MINNVYALVDKICDEFVKVSSKYLAEESDSSTKTKRIRQTVTKLKTHQFRDSVLIADKFLDNTFEQKLDDNPNLIGFNNGVYDHKNRYFRAGNPNDYISLSVGYDYEQYLQNDDIIREIKSFFSTVHPDINMQKYILTFIASCLEGINKDNRFTIWKGKNGSNGISSTFGLILYTFGDYFGVLRSTVLTKEYDLDSATPELAHAKGKRFVMIQELDYNAVIYTGLIKLLSGSDYIVARPLYGDRFIYRPQFKMVLACNKLPQLSSNDEGAFRRILVSPWESEFVNKPLSHQYQKDPQLMNKIKTWKSAFMWLLLNEYYPEYCEHGLRVPEKVIEETRNYRENCNPSWKFLTAHSC